MIEYAKMVGIMISIMAAAWLILQPAVDNHIIQVMEAENVARRVEVENLQADIQRRAAVRESQIQRIDGQIKVIDNNQDQLSVTIQRMDTQIDNIEKLAKESRELQLKLLFELRGRDTGQPRE